MRAVSHIERLYALILDNSHDDTISLLIAFSVHEKQRGEERKRERGATKDDESLVHGNHVRNLLILDG